MAYDNNQRGNLGQGQGELPSHPSGVTMVQVCPRCSHEIADCSCHDFKNEDGAQSWG
jgi:hypothetical protein